MHDSEHTYENMTWEFQTVWPYLKTGGLLLSHDVEANSAFPDLCTSVKGKSFVFERTFGGIVKEVKL